MVSAAGLREEEVSGFPQDDEDSPQVRFWRFPGRTVHKMRPAAPQAVLVDS